MSIDLINTYAIGNEDIENMQVTLDKVFVGKGKISITERYTDVRPEIAAGSIIESAGGLYVTGANTAISTIDPYTAASIPNDVIYIIFVPGVSVLLPAFTTTEPVWSDAKQGWYGTGAFANAVYAPYMMERVVTEYIDKYRAFGDDGERTFYIERYPDSVPFTNTWATISGNIVIPGKKGQIWKITCHVSVSGDAVTEHSMELGASTTGTGNLFVSGVPSSTSSSYQVVKMTHPFIASLAEQTATLDVVESGDFYITSVGRTSSLGGVVFRVFTASLVA